MKLFHVISTSILGAAMAIGVGLAVANTQRAMKADAAAGDSASGNWEAVTSTSDIVAGTDYLLGYNYSGTDYFSKSTSLSSNALQTTSTISQAKMVRFVAVTGGWNIQIASSTYLGYGSSGTDLATNSSGGTGAKYVWVATQHANGDIYFTTNSANRFLGAASAGENKNIKGYATSNLATYPRVTAYKQTTKTLSSIALSGSMTKTSYTTADNWNPNGLVVTGTYSDSTTADITASSTFSYYNSSDVEKSSPKLFGVCSGETLKVVAHHTGVSDTAKYVASTSITITKAAEFELVTDATKLTKGTTALIVGTGVYNATTYTKAMIATHKTSNGSFGSNADVTLSNGFNAGSVATSGSATVFTLGGSAGAWTLSSGDDKLGFTGSSNNNVQFNEDMTDTFTSASSSNYVTIESNTHSGRGLRMNVNNGSPLFSNYGSGNQQPVYLFANIAEVTYGTTDHIDVATLPQTHWHVGQTFSDSGIMINAWDNAVEASGNSKVVTEYTTSISDVTYGQPFTDSDIGPHTVTVTYTENAHDYTDTYQIYVYATATYQLVTEEPAGGWAGSYLITATISGATEVDKVADGSYAMRSTGVNLDYVGNYAAINPTTTAGVTTVVTGQEFQFSIAAMAGGYSIQGKDGKYIGWGSSSNNGLSSSDSALLNTIEFNAGIVSIVCSAGTKGLKLDKSSGQFRYYSPSFNIQLYKLVESSAASAYADEFLNLLSTGTNPVCKYNESTHEVSTDLEELQLAWALLYIDFNDLTNTDKQLFTQGTADSSGDNIEQTLALYDHIVAAYGASLESDDCHNYNFMNRSVGAQPGQVSVTSHLSNNTVITIVIITSVIALTSVGCFFIIRRKKHN